MIDITTDELARAHLIGGNRVFVVADERGESTDYEAYSLECRTLAGERVWTEGIRKDRSTMYPAYAAAIEPALATLKGKVHQ